MRVHINPASVTRHGAELAIGGAAVILIAVVAAALSSGHTHASTGTSSSSVQPTEGPDYDAAMQRCALSRLSNGGGDPSTDNPRYLDAYTACTYGRDFDSVTAPGRGWGAADPGYWAP